MTRNNYPKVPHNETYIISNTLFCIAVKAKKAFFPAINDNAKKRSVLPCSKTDKPLVFLFPSFKKLYSRLTKTELRNSRTDT